MEWWEFLLVLALVMPIVVLWLGCIIDVIGRPDLSGGKKVLWLVFVLLLPLIGSLVYILVRPKVIVGPASALDETWEGAPRGMFDIGIEEPTARPRDY